MFYDLTTKEGIRGALDKGGLVASLLGMGMLGGLMRLTASGMSRFEKEQVETAEALIKQGREQGVKHMKIKLGRNASAKFSAPIEGVNISFGAEANGDVEMDVEYKD
ncbi:MAG: hypothetical protein Q4E56_01625 [Pseudomonadota bacterium]|nr:hypothetical protein [Pseudomonadota bacterium]